MNKETRRKCAFLVAIILLQTSVLPLNGVVKTTKAASKSIYVFGDTCFDSSTANYITVNFSNYYRVGGIYTATVSNTNVAEVTGSVHNEFSILVKKAETFKVTVKERYKGKTRNLGTKTVKMKKNVNVSEEYAYINTYFNKVSMEQGTSIALPYIVDCVGNIKINTENANIVSLSKFKGNDIITANEIGTTDIMLEIQKEKDGYYTYQEFEDGSSMIGERQYITINVVEKSENPESIEGCNKADKIAEYYNIEKTRENAFAMMKKIKALGIDSESCINSEGKVVIPTQYSYEQIKGMLRKCENLMGLTGNEYGVSLEAVKMTKLTEDKVTFQLSHAVTEKELKAIDAGKYNLILSDKKNWYYFTSTIKKGSTKITGTILNGKLKKGQTYYAVTGGRKSKVIKTLKSKCVASKDTIKFDNMQNYVEVGENVAIKLLGTKKNTKITWSIKDESIAEVSNKGVVTGKKIGSTYIYANINKKQYKCKLIVSGKSPLSISSTYLTLIGGDVAYMDVRDAYRTLENVTWHSNDTGIVEISEDGKVTAVGVGITQISATVGNEKVECTVAVKPEPVLYLSCQAKNGVIRIVGYHGESKEIKIPKVINGNEVTRIEEYVFWDCSNLQKVYIPDSVISIAEDAFEEECDIVIQTTEGSYAEQYAEEHGIKVEYLDK